MSRSPLALLTLFVLIGCARGSIELGDEDDDGSGSSGDDGGTGAGEGDGGAGDGGAGDGGADGGADGGGADGGTPGDGDGGASVDWSGLYQGDLDITVLSDWGDWDLGTCATSLVVEPSGPLSGAATCSTSDWGGDTYEVPITGDVSDDGQVTASAQLDLGWSGAVELDITGAIEGDVMDLDVRGNLGSDYGSVQIEGQGELDRQ